MSYFNNNKWSPWIITLLILLNMATLASIWWRPAPPHQPKSAELLQQALQLDEQQAAQFETLSKQHFQATKEVHQTLLGKKREMIKYLTSTPSDTAAARTLATEIGILQQQLDNLLIDHFLSLKAICQPEQQKNLGEIFLKSMNRQKLSKGKKK